jgi:hypothetical protein
MDKPTNALVHSTADLDTHGDQASPQHGENKTTLTPSRHAMHRVIVHHMDHSLPTKENGTMPSMCALLFNADHCLV